MARLVLRNKKIMVIGGAGFIGSNLVDELIKQGNRVVVIDNLSSGRKENLHPKAALYKADVRSKKISVIFKKEKPDVVFHLAAQPLVQKAYENPLLAIETNVMGTVNVLEACRKCGAPESIVVVSSDKAYGKSEALPYQEHTALRGDHPYDASKSAADLLAQAYHKTYHLPIAIARFSNVFGPGDLNFSRIIPGVMEAAIKNKKLLVRSNGKLVREYTFVKDIVDGCIKLAEKTKEYPGHSFNFGSKNVFNVIEVIEKTQKVLRKKIPYEITNTAKNEIPEQYLDWAKAKKVLGWQPKTSFENGIKETFNWLKNSHFKN